MAKLTLLKREGPEKATSVASADQLNFTLEWQHRGPLQTIPKIHFLDPQLTNTRPFTHNQKVLLQRIGSVGKILQMTSITDIFPNSGPSVDLNEEYFADLKLKADGGDREAQFQLAQHYDQGPKGEENSKHAFELYKLSADSGHEQAQLKLGHYFANGVGTEVDPQESFRYAKLSADQGNTVAQASIANFYKKGFGVVQSDENAMAYFVRAADGRHGDAAFAAGNGFYEGVGVPVDKVEALKYFKIAANQSHADAQAKCAEMHAMGEGTEVNLVLAAGYYQLAAIEWGKLGNVYRLTAGSPDFCEEQRAKYYALSVKHLSDAAESGMR